MNNPYPPTIKRRINRYITKFLKKQNGILVKLSYSMITSEIILSYRVKKYNYTETKVFRNFDILKSYCELVELDR